MGWKNPTRNLLGNRRQPASTAPRSGIGSRTQFAGIGAGAEHQQLVIGLDFGTAFTKVVVGEHRARFAVPINPTGQGVNQYLLPSVVWLDDSDACHLSDPGGGKMIGDMKIAIINGQCPEQTQAAICVYLALVFRRTRAYIFDNKANLYRNAYIDWFVNVGIPTDPFHQDPISELYRRIVWAAWVLSVADGVILLSDAQALLATPAYHANQGKGWLDPDVVGVVPEFAAQVTGYLRSPLRREDLHLLIDIGAGTMDVTVFNVHYANGEHQFPIFAMAVQPLGTQFLIRHRLQGRNTKATSELGPLSNVPDIARFAQLLSITPDELRQRDVPFLRRVLQVLLDLLRYTQQHMYRISPHWQSGIPTFICGGGANCDFYKDHVASRTRLATYPLDPSVLPVPRDLAAPGLNAAHYDRISVAYGLSFDQLNIGVVVRQHNIDPDDDPPPSGGTRIEICKRCNGTGGLYQPCAVCGGSGHVWC